MNIRYMLAKLREWWQDKFAKKTCDMPANIPHGKVGEDQCQQHDDDKWFDNEANYTLFEQDMAWCRKLAGWDPISKEDLVERFGETPQNIAKAHFPDFEFEWFVNDVGEVKGWGR